MSHNSKSDQAPNHALQRTATRVTLAAFHVRSRLVRSGLFHTSLAPFFAPPLQPARRAPQSLSLGSLGVATRVVFNGAFPPLHLLQFAVLS